MGAYQGEQMNNRRKLIVALGAGAKAFISTGDRAWQD
jgi:hypothetical protein